MDSRQEGPAGAARRGGSDRQATPEPVAQTTDRPALSPLADLADRVMIALTGMSIHGLTVSAGGKGTVRLDGAVRTESDWLQAERLTRDVPGIVDVVNNLRVDPLVGSVPIDPTVLSPELAAEVELTHEEFVPGTEMDFNREDTGTTDVEEATGEAVPFFPPTDPVVEPAPRADEGIEVVGGWSGTSMEAPINLEGLPAELLAGDDEIARLVRLALAEDAATVDLPIHVFVRDGVVHLRGVVPSLADADLAEEVASRVPGAAEIREELDVAG